MSNCIDKIKIGFVKTTSTSETVIEYYLDNNDNLIFPSKVYNPSTDGEYIQSLYIYFNENFVASSPDLSQYWYVAYTYAKVEIINKRPRVFNLKVPEGVKGFTRLNSTSYSSYSFLYVYNKNILNNTYSTVNLKSPSQNHYTSFSIYNFTIGIECPTTMNSFNSKHINGNSIEEKYNNIGNHISYIKFNHDILTYISNGITKIYNNYFFQKMFFLEQIDFPESFSDTIYTDFYLEPYYMFRDCYMLETINNFFTNFVISSGTFFNCPCHLENLNIVNMLSVSLYSSYPPFDSCNIDNLTFNDCILSYIPNYLFTSSNIKNVTISSSILNINENAFKNSNIESIDLSNSSITSLSNDMFKEVYSLENITLPTTLITIGNNCFEGTSIKRINIPVNVNYIGREAFKNCKSLESISILNSNNSDIRYGTFEGCILLKSFAFNSNLVNLEDRAFYNSGLENIDLSSINSFSNLGISIFSNCENLKTVRLGSSITKITSNMFRECKSLKQINLNYIINIYSYSFYKCSSLSEITFSKDLELISDHAFEDCNNLKTVIIENKDQSLLEKIMTYAFYNCNNLSSFTFPDSIEYIGSKAFENTNIWDYYLGNNITSISDDSFNFYIYLENNGNLDENGVLLYNDDCKSINFKNNKNIKKVIIDDTVYSLPDGCFFNCYNLEEVTLGSNITKIPNKAFYNCTSLKKIIFSENSSFYIDEHVTLPIKEINNQESTVKNDFGYPFTGDKITFIEDGYRTNEYNIYYDNINENSAIDYFITKKNDGFFHGGSIQDIYYNNESISGFIYMDENFLSIGKEAFFNCKSLIDFEYDNNKILYIQTIKERAFFGCSSLITFGNNENRIRITKLNNKCFYNCTSLNKLNIKFSMIQLYNLYNRDYYYDDKPIISRNFIHIGKFCFKNTSLYKNGKFKVFFYVSKNDEDIYPYTSYKVLDEFKGAFLRLDYKNNNEDIKILFNEDDIYHLNETKTINENIELCKIGYHYYENLFDVFNNYNIIYYTNHNISEEGDDIFFNCYTINENNDIIPGICNYSKLSFCNYNTHMNFQEYLYTNNNNVHDYTHDYYYMFPRYNFLKNEFNREYTNKGNYNGNDHLIGFNVVTSIDNGNIDIRGNKDSKHVTNSMTIKNIYDTNKLLRIISDIDDEESDN